MERITGCDPLLARLQSLRSNGKSIALVPTMGALHRGHLSLVESALNDCNIVVVSDFVNPTQFNDPKDYQTYPRNIEKDAHTLAPYGERIILFTPEANDIYARPDLGPFNFMGLDKRMEGASRPGHFQGVVRIVSRLFDIVRPEKAYFGEKDYQQLLIVRALASQMVHGPQVVGCPIVREENGLALSSRNALLTPQGRMTAAQVYPIIRDALRMNPAASSKEIEERVEAEINSIPGVQCEYFVLRNPTTLEASDSPQKAMGFVAYHVEGVRLIDNVKYLQHTQAK